MKYKAFTIICKKCKSKNTEIKYFTVGYEWEPFFFCNKCKNKEMT